MVVVHDVLRGNAERIGEFIELARLQGHEFVAAVDPDCLPIVDGEIRADLRQYTTRTTSA